MIDEKNILVTGGSGLLGSELKKLLPRAQFPTREQFDLTDKAQMEKYLNGEGKGTGVILHAAAFMPPPASDKEPAKSIETNIVGTANLVTLCIPKNIRFVYISADYVFSGDKGNYSENDELLPTNNYAWSKLGGECSVHMYSNSLIIRTSFGEKIFPYPKAFVDQWTSKQTVDIIAEKIVKLIRADAVGIFHIGGKRITRYEFAKSLPNGSQVGKLKRSELTYKAPRDNSLNTSKYDKFMMAFDKKNK